MGVFELGNPEGKGAQAVLEIQVLGGGGQKTMPSVGGVWIFSGITQCVWRGPGLDGLLPCKHCYKISIHY